MKSIRTLAVLGVAMFAGYAMTSCTSKEPVTEEIVLCADCGMEKGGEGCCAADAVRCEDCSKIKGSPGCCK